MNVASLISTKAFFRAILTSNKFNTHLMNYMNKIPNDPNSLDCMQKDIELILRFHLMIEKEIEKIKKLNHKFLFSIIVDRRNKEYIIRLDVYGNALRALLEHRQNKIIADQHQDDKNKENSFDMMEMSVTGDKHLIVMLFDKVDDKSINYPNGIQLDSGIYYDITDLQFLGIINNRTYQLGVVDI